MKAKAKGGPLLITQGDLSQVVGLPTWQILRWARSGADGFPTPVRVVQRTYLFDRAAVLEWFRLRSSASAGARG